MTLQVGDRRGQEEAGLRNGPKQVITPRPPMCHSSRCHWHVHKWIFFGSRHTKPELAKSGQASLCLPLMSIKVSSLLSKSVELNSLSLRSACETLGLTIQGWRLGWPWGGTCIWSCMMGEQYSGKTAQAHAPSTRWKYSEDSDGDWTQKAQNKIGQDSTEMA